MIYFDHNSSTPIDPAAAAAMTPFLLEHHGNPSSPHAPGRAMRAAVDHARSQIAAMLEVNDDEVIFNSGGSEGCNHAIKGAAWARMDAGRHIVTTVIEHAAILKSCAFLEENGFEVTRVGVDSTGMVDPDDIRTALRPDTILVSVMLANNEVGTIQPIADIAKIARDSGAWMHTDAAQAVGKIPVTASGLGVDLLTFAGHKCYAPQGIGAMFIREGVTLEPLIHGAGHEKGRRAGTEPVANVVALGKAAELVRTDRSSDKTRRQRDTLQQTLQNELGDDVVVHGHPTERLPGTLSIAFRGKIGAEVLANAPEICASAGAACHGDKPFVSPVLSAMGVSPELALGTVRFSLGRYTTDEEVERAAKMIVNAAHSA
ncbi:MAG TPA: cysteine desulfurase family protein [Phycisphaerae bacterium]|nr:cysteine desulfurase family protein [Phycisphaerae bacterium]